MPARKPPKRKPSVLKRQRQNLKRRAQNSRYLSELKTYSKKLREIVARGDKEKALEVLRQVQKKFDKAAQNGYIKVKNASRHISRLTVLVNGLINKK
ncbi:MAG: 30S ribosomal protein S20 [Deltaproteobacteria bacterium]|nr:30S ribosomal protein S20 [Deltaproteobacteria bacterium]